LEKTVRLKLCHIFDHNFQSFLFGAWILSAFVDLLLTEALRFMFELQVDVLPAGM